MHDLDRDSAVQCGVNGKKHHSHAPAAELALQAIVGTQCRLQCSEEIERRIAHIE
jgi:hypothetical protein